MKILLQKARGSLSIVSSFSVCLSVSIWVVYFLIPIFMWLLLSIIHFFPLSFTILHLSSLISSTSLISPFFLSSSPSSFIFLFSTFHLSHHSLLSLSLWWWMMRPNHSTATQSLKQILASASSFSRIVQSPLPTLWGIEWEKLLKEKEILVFPWVCMGNWHDIYFWEVDMSCGVTNYSPGVSKLGPGRPLSGRV